MLDSQESNYRFHKAIQDAYVATNAWLSGMRDISGYKVLKYDEVTSMLREKTLLSAATQFHTFFPAHFFKVACTLEQVITGPRLVEWLGHNPRVCLVDVGCGAGAASAAFVDIILRLQEAGRIKNSIQVCCIGIDPNPYAIALYATFLKELRNRLPLSRLDLVCKIKPSGIPSATSWIIQLLDQRRSDWKLPNIPHVMIMQVNIVSPLDKDHTDQEASYRILAGLGIEASDTTTAHSEFGVEQALAYKSILEGVGVDHMHVVTIGTDDYLLGERVEEMGAALQRVLDDGLHQTRLIGGQYQVKFYNPVGSRFQWNTDLVDRQFYANVISVTSRDWQGDTDWHEVVSLENLRLAWARARYALLRESFTDELEIRLFESNLDESLERMRYQLMAYAEHVASRDDHVAYKVPKSQTSVRPRGLSPIEEELLSVAVVQKLGHRESRLRQCSYAYRIAQKSAGRDTEYLYEYWLSAYKKFLEDAREQAKKYENCAVLRTDIKSFYTRIEQDKLVRLTVQALTENRSQRIEWLIRMLLSRDLDDHEVGRGIVQGNIGSGFYANIYLTAVDILFGANNGWGLKFFRYVDDMIFIIPEPEDARPVGQVLGEVKQALEDVLHELKLELNEKKTEVYNNASEFVRNAEPDPLLEKIGDECDGLTDRLWILDSACRNLFIRCADNEELWWYRIRLYCRCLQETGYYCTAPLVSRWIYRYLFDRRRRKKDLRGNSELTIGELPSEEVLAAMRDWSVTFNRRNPTWVNDREELHTKLVDVFLDAWNTLSAVDPPPPALQRRMETRLRFAVFRLGSLGFGEVAGGVVEILLNSPWVTKEPASVVESLARQGYAQELLDIFSHYRGDIHEMNQYLRAVVLRAIRFLPEVSEEHWDIIAECAVQGTLVEQLMATETWLFLSDTPGFLEQGKYASVIGEELTKSVPLRLAKNYVLLLSQYGLAEMPDYGLDGPPALRYAHQIGSSRETSGLLSYAEPSVIRESFYGGRRAGESDVEYVS